MRGGQGHAGIAPRAPHQVDDLPAQYRALVVAVAELGVPVVRNESMAQHTTFRIGGPADLYVPAPGVELLEELVTLAASTGVPATILGGGSNILVSDRGVRGLVIANQARAVHAMDHGPAPAGSLPQVVADSGAPLAGLARWAIHAGWAGLEWAVSVPGTVGGAVIGNAGAHGGEIADSLAWALVTDSSSGRQYLTSRELGYSYRSSTLKQQLATRAGSRVVLAAGFQLAPGDAGEMTERADAFLARRRATQPVEPSAGSIFRNPPGDHAGRLIEANGLKGQRIGGAQVSPRHANFIVNAGGATAADVRSLIDLVRERVFEKSGIELAPEILFVGEWQ